MKKLLLLTSILSVLLIAGCSGENAPAAVSREKIYPKITKHQMELNIIFARGTYYISEGAPTIRFQFINNGLAKVSLPEWKTRELENVRIQYAYCPKRGGSLTLPESEWKESPRTVLPGDCPRYPLELEPQNSIIMEIPLPFIGTLKQPGRYAVRGVMDLTSLPIQSKPIELLIR